MEQNMRKEKLERLKGYQTSLGEMTDVVWVDAKDAAPKELQGSIGIAPQEGYFRVSFTLRPSAQSDIKVVVALPEEKYWNGKFLGTGNGGSAGVIIDPFLINGVNHRYAAANTDMGMSLTPDEFIGKEEVWRDFGYRATHLMTVISKELIEYFYGKKPEYSYFMGGSTGGQQGFSEAQRYPDDYDGIVSLSPAFDRVRLHTFFVWNWQQIHSREHAGFTAEDAKYVSTVMRKKYGSELCICPSDEFLSYPGGINGLYGRNPLDDEEVREELAKGLNQDQMDALRCIYSGPADPVTGEKIIAAFLPGTEAEGLGLVDTSDREGFAKSFFYLFRWIFGADFDFLKFDFHKDFMAAAERLSPILDAADPDLEAYRKRGGKLLVIGGSSDPIVPYTGFLDYYHKVEESMGGFEKVDDFMRFFLMPGFAHTFGGPGVQDVGWLGLLELPQDPAHDAICALDQWVSRGMAPEKLLGVRYKTEGGHMKYDHSRTAYAFPNVTVYNGGDCTDPENYLPERNAKKYE